MGGVTLPSHAKRHDPSNPNDHKPWDGAIPDQILIVSADGTPINSAITLGAIASGLKPAGPWDATMGYPTPTIEGQFWWITVAGNLGGVDYEIGDWLVYIDSTPTWDKVDNTDRVTSVEGRTGAVKLKDADIYMDGKQIALSTITWAKNYAITPPVSPIQNEIWMIGHTATGAWTGHSGELAIWRNPAWEFFPQPEKGCIVYATDTDRIWRGNGSGGDWRPIDQIIKATEILNFIDALNRDIRLSKMWAKEMVKDALVDPPVGAISGDRYLVKNGATGDWSGQDGNIATKTATSWGFYPAPWYSVWFNETDRKLWMRSYPAADWEPYTMGMNIGTQATGIFVSGDRGDDTDGDGSLFNPFETIQTAINFGAGRGDNTIQIILDTNSPAYTGGTVPTGERVSITSWQGFMQDNPGQIITINIENLGELFLNGVRIVNIKEAAGISLAKIYAEECLIQNIKDSTGAGYATNTQGFFSNTAFDTAGEDDALNMGSCKGTGFDWETGRLILFKSPVEDWEAVDLQTLIGAYSATNQANFIYCSQQKGSNVDGDGSLFNPYETIQHALDQIGENEHKIIIVDETADDVAQPIATGDALSYKSATIVFHSSMSSWYGGISTLEIGDQWSLLINSAWLSGNVTESVGCTAAEILLENCAATGTINTPNTDLTFMGTVVNDGAITASSKNGFALQMGTYGLITYNGIKANGKITDVTDPTAAQDAATLNYVEGRIGTLAGQAAKIGTSDFVGNRVVVTDLVNQRLVEAVISTAFNKDFAGDGSADTVARSDHTHTINELTDAPKTGTVAGASFAGNPRTYTVVFNTPMASTNYVVMIMSTSNKVWTVFNKTVNGFSINSNSANDLTGETVDWMATIHNNP